MVKNIFDLIGVGFGPSNIALAVAHKDKKRNYKIKFLDAAQAAGWQEGAMIKGSDIQHNPLRDFITPVNPSSEFGFLSYLKSEDRLFNFLNLDSPYPPRADYSKYVKWVAEKFADDVLYSQSVCNIELINDGPSRKNQIFKVDTTSGHTHYSRSLSFGPGRIKNIPNGFEKILGKDVVHFTNYLPSVNKWRKDPSIKSVAVIGSSQSAVEVILDLHSKMPDTEIHSIFRNFSLLLKDTSPFTENLLYPSFTDYFYHSSDNSKVSLNNQTLRSNYGSVDHDILSKLYYTLYENSALGNETIRMLNNQRIKSVSRVSKKIELVLKEVHRNKEMVLKVDAIVLATGFKNSGNQSKNELVHPLLKNISNVYAKNDNGTLFVCRNYQLKSLEKEKVSPPVFINGLCEPTHGLGDAGSFSLLSYRAMEIDNALAYTLEK